MTLQEADAVKSVKIDMAYHQILRQVWKNEGIEMKRFIQACLDESPKFNEAKAKYPEVK